MATSREVIDSFNGLSEAEKKEAAAVIAKSRGLKDPSQKATDTLWLIVVLTFAIVLVGGTLLLFTLVREETSTEVIGPIVTGALGVLAGLLAPSPVQSNS